MAETIEIKTTQNNPQEESLQQYGKVFFNWEFPEYKKYQRGIWWYIVTALAAIGLIIWALLSQQNYLFVAIIIISLIIVFIAYRREPDVLPIAITEDGISIGEKFYYYERIKKFWIAYNPPLAKTLYLKINSFSKPVFSISLENINPVALRNKLLEYIEEDLDQDGETASDAWERLLKL